MSVFTNFFDETKRTEKKRLLLVFAVFVGFVSSASAQFSISGKVLNRRNQEPVDFAIVAVPNSGLWANANAKGEFIIKNIPAGKVKLSVQYLGFVKREYEYTLDRNISGIILLMDEDNLTLSQVEITAKKGTDLATSFLMDRTALDHIQIQSVTDATALLPGGKTRQPLTLASTSEQRFQINGYSSERGNATFGVGVEVDGVRLSNNGLRDLSASTSVVQGVDTKNISTSNIESIEIITGIPSVEHGDMTNGMVKINTRKGLSPYLLELATRPNTKQIALNKGISLGENNGVLNFGIDHTKSIANLASPFTTYDRNTISLNYNNTFNRKNEQPITFNVGITGNNGGFNSERDPDLLKSTYEKQNDNTIRANFFAKWLLNKPWITNIEASGNINYNDRISEVSVLKETSSSTPSVRTTQEGYHVGQPYAINPNAPIILIPLGRWYEVEFLDNKLINYNARLKGNWFKKIGKVDNNFLLGGDFSVSGNNGRGKYYGDIATAPSWREYPYSLESFTNNYAAYAENSTTIPINKSTLQIVAGVRSELTSIGGSEYGDILNWSPRANVKYTFWEKESGLMEDLSVKVSWGKTVKLPGFDALYPTPSFKDVRTFEAGTTASGETFYGYYTLPRTRIFNSNLQWQNNVQQEIAISTTIAGNRIYVTASRERTNNPYISGSTYEPFYYKFTSQKDLEASTIPQNNRIYTVNATGVVTVTDATGAKPSEMLSYTDRYEFLSNGFYQNGSPVTRHRITWTVDFKQIKVLRTAFRIDGNYYQYKGLEETVIASMPNSTQLMKNGLAYKYIGFYVGGANSANGSITRSVDMNFTVTTHIPAIRLVLSARLEGSFFSFSRSLSEANGKERGIVLDNRDAYEPSTTMSGIYGGNRFVATYPNYYTSLEDLSTKIPFAEKFLWAKTNDPDLYNELAKLVVKSNYNYNFNANTTSNYYSANLNVTKEIGRFASLSFFANNFFHNMGKVRFLNNGNVASLFNSSFIPAFNYGASLRLKF